MVANATSLGYNVPAQVHLDPQPIAHFGSWQIDEENRKMSAAKSLPPPGQRGYPDVYVNGEDVTVTVDPLKNASWIRDDGSSWRYPQSRHRGALKDHQGVQRAVAQVDRHEPGPSSFCPTSQQLDGIPKFTPRCVTSSTHGWMKHSPNGQLPVHSKMVYDGRLRGTLIQDVETAFHMEHTHGDRRRFFDCGGDAICR